MTQDTRLQEIDAAARLMKRARRRFNAEISGHRAEHHAKVLQYLRDTYGLHEDNCVLRVTKKRSARTWETDFLVTDIIIREDVTAEQLAAGRLPDVIGYYRNRRDGDWAKHETILTAQQYKNSMESLK